MVKKRSYLFFLTAIVIVFIDQLTKQVIKKGLLNIQYHLNSGSLWGIFQNSAMILSWLSIIVVGVFLYNFEKIQKSNKIMQISSGLVVGGAIGNLIDRLLYKGVIDFISLGWWPSFNIADSCLVAGIALFILVLMKENNTAKKTKVL
jgi:signal peptidase II